MNSIVEVILFSVVVMQLSRMFYLLIDSFKTSGLFVLKPLFSLFQSSTTRLLPQIPRVKFCLAELFSYDLSFLCVGAELCYARRILSRGTCKGTFSGKEPVFHGNCYSWQPNERTRAFCCAELDTLNSNFHRRILFEVHFNPVWSSYLLCTDITV